MTEDEKPAALPVYAQIAYDIAAKIACGEIKEQERFSGRSLMGAQYRVSPETIRRAMRLLSDMGITEIRENVGSVVLSKARAVEYVEPVSGRKRYEPPQMRAAHPY